LLKQDQHDVTITDIVNLYRRDATNQDMLRRASELPSLPESWREYFRKRLWNADN
jgi:MOSC domain-containing protein YiiM